jgi:hypothetical protein
MLSVVCSNFSSISRQKKKPVFKIVSLLVNFSNVEVVMHGLFVVWRE